MQKAVNSPSEEVGIKTKNINMWCDAETVWIPEHYILNSSANIDFNDFINRDCYMGIDLSSTSDLTCAAFMFPTEEKYYFKVNTTCRKSRFKRSVSRNFMGMAQAGIDNNHSGKRDGL